MADLYSTNKLTNPGAESGTTGWTISNVTVVDGGTAGTKCFCLAATASMSQEQTFSIQPPDFKVAVNFLPQYEPPERDTQVYASLKVQYEYSDGTIDTFIIPCRSDALGVI